MVPAALLVDEDDEPALIAVVGDRRRVSIEGRRFEREPLDRSGSASETEMQRGGLQVYGNAGVCQLKVHAQHVVKKIPARS